MKKNNNLRRAQLDRFFEQLQKLNLMRPKLGWVKEVREALGMSMQDLAIRLGTIKQRIERIEKDELSGRVTMDSMQKVAEALNCSFIYFLVPKQSLDETVNAQAQKVAEHITKSVEKTMRLELQGSSEKERKQAIESIKNRILTEDRRKLWRKK